MRSLLLLLLIIPSVVFGQSSHQPDAAEIRLKLEKLNFLGSVLYLAAHPDDENTNIIAYLSNERLATTGYLSLTRGDGGQNLIGSEIRDRLGLIRTQELLAARSIDGGEQFFTRAIDFGYSKSADEAFAMWGRDSVLSDATRIVRKFQPDVIIRRFPPDARAGHGHHTASAIVAEEVFDLAARPDAFPAQVAELGTWQVKRLYTNTGRWWTQSIDENTAGVITLDVGGYNALLGKSYSEISALSSSQHKSQGWGRRGLRGYRPEYLEHMKGDSAKADIFEGIDTSWKRVPGGDLVHPLVERAIAEFDPRDPAATVQRLLEIRDTIGKLQHNVWTTRKLEEVEHLIVDCLGLYVEVTASHYQIAPGELVTATIELINRSDYPVRIAGIETTGLTWDSTFTADLRTNHPTTLTVKTHVPSDASFSDPYWLRESHTTGLYTVANAEMIGMPQNDPAVGFTFEIAIGDRRLRLTRPLIYKWVDPVRGELWRPFEIVPPVTVNLSEEVMVFGSQEPRQMRLLLRSSSDKPLRGTVRLSLPDGWRAEPPTSPFELNARGAEALAVVSVFPSAIEHTGVMRAIVNVDGKDYDRALQLIAYDHFPAQTLLPRAEAKAVRIDLKTAGQRIGYIRGAGDDIPAALRNMGYTVVEMNNDDITPQNLRGMNAVVLGVRALNTNERSRYFMPAVLEYAKNGGTVVVQYNTNARLLADQFSPYSLEIGRDRVADETAKVTILKPTHPVMITPNKINAKDFDGWVQERGLYFPSQWDQRFEAVLSMADPGEQQKTSSLLVARYGEGYFVYTGLSFFRQLPEGVAGAYKLFANLVSLGNGTPPRGKAKNK